MTYRGAVIIGTSHLTVCIRIPVATELRQAKHWSTAFRLNASPSGRCSSHGKDDWGFLSGTQVREMLERREMLPAEFTRPEVARVLLEGVQRRAVLNPTKTAV